MVDLAVLADHRVKLKESNVNDKYMELTSELKKKKLWNMKVTTIPIVIGALAIVTKGLIQVLKGLKIRKRFETIQTTVLLRSVQILRRVL